MSIKDYFSNHAKIYAAFRPTYPKALYEHVYSFVNSFDTAWDCATGNGQVAGELATKFKNVFATDISENQLSEAIEKQNIIYSLSPAEKTDFSSHQFDLITVGQALHWFDLNKFYDEVKRVMKPGGVLAIWGYALLSISPAIDQKFLHFYNHKVGDFWDAARKMVEDEYRYIPFPFTNLPSPSFEIIVHWNRKQFGGYLESWSATQKFIKANGYNPVPDFLAEIDNLWSEEEIKKVTFPVFTKIGRV